MLESGEKIWRVKEEPASASWLAGKIGISKLLASILIHRKVSTPDAVKSFLSAKLVELRDPFLLKDMDRAVELITECIKNKERITVYGDYDADGITATALLVDFLSRLQTPISFYIPHRLDEGYSLNEAAVREVASGDTRLIITVDCGISSAYEVYLAGELGLGVIVTDHHQPPADFEPRCPTINPVRQDCSFPFKELSGVGVAFYLAIALRSRLREEGFFSGGSEPDLRSYLDLVALGTVADIVPLLEENRILVKNGLRILRESRRPGIRELLRVSGIREGQEITTYDIAFRLAPRLNAMGRLGSVRRAVRLLTIDDEAEAAEIANQMDTLNAQRQAIENRILSEVRQRITRIGDLEKRRTIVLSDPSWHRGVVGIVASKIVEEYYRPTLILEVEGELLRGSGRSIEGFNLYQALSDLSDLLSQFGGHQHAAGLTLGTESLIEFSQRFEELAEHRLDPEHMVPRIDVDAKLGLESISPQLIGELEKLPPFGHQNPQPIFWAGPLEVVSSTVVGNDHLKLRIREKGITYDCIAFGKGSLHPLEGKWVDILFHVSTNTWQGIEWIQLVVADLRLNS